LIHFYKRKMDLESINVGILRSLCKTLKIKTEKTVSSSLIENVCSRLSDGKFKSGKLEDLFKILTNLGLDLSHIKINKVESRDEIHTYLLLDFLNLLFEALLSDNPVAFNSFIKSCERTIEDEVGGGTTSGAEEVDRILEAARKKYGKIRSFREKIVKEDISIISKVPPPYKQTNDISEVDHHAKFGKVWTKSVDDASSNVNRKPEVANVITRKPEVVNASTEMSSQSLNSFSSKSKSSSRSNYSSTLDDGSLRKRKRKHKEVDENEVNIRIPLEDASINVKVKSSDGKSLGNRRIHVRLRQEASPVRSKRIVYGTKSVLFHHHRKNRPPVFSKPPPAPVLEDDQVLEKAVQKIKKRRREEVVKGEEQSKTSRQDNVKLATQKYLRELRTRNGQLKKLAADLKN